MAPGSAVWPPLCAMPRQAPSSRIGPAATGHFPARCSSTCSACAGRAHPLHHARLADRDLLGYALTAGATVAEVPISYTAGESSFRLATAWEALNAWRRL